MNPEEILRLLPDVYQRGSMPGAPLAAVLQVMGAMLTPVEAAFEKFITVLNPELAPDEFIPFLARWVGLSSHLESGETRTTVPPVDSDRLRSLVSIASHLARWRGTRRGLLLFLETATGLSGFKIEEQTRGEDGNLRPFYVHLTCPPGAKEQLALIRTIVTREKPAHVTCEISFD